jgi:hypothetical protein
MSDERSIPPSGRPLFGDGDELRRSIVESLRVAHGSTEEFAEMVRRGRANTGPAIFSLSDGDLAPDWTTDDAARWHGAGRKEW